MLEPAATEPKPAQAETPDRPAPATTEPMPARIKPEQAAHGETKAVRVKPVLIKADLARSSKVRAGRVKAPKMLAARLRGSAPITVPPVGLPVSMPQATPLVAATPELVLSHRAPVMVADARPGGPEQMAEPAELTSALRSSSAPSGSAAGSATGLAAVGGLLVLGLASTRMTARGRKRRGAAR